MNVFLKQKPLSDSEWDNMDNVIVNVREEKRREEKRREEKLLN